MKRSYCIDKKNTNLVTNTTILAIGYITYWVVCFFSLLRFLAYIIRIQNHTIEERSDGRRSWEECYPLPPDPSKKRGPQSPKTFTINRDGNCTFIGGRYYDEIIGGEVDIRDCGLLLLLLLLLLT